MATVKHKSGAKLYTYVNVTLPEDHDGPVDHPTRKGEQVHPGGAVWLGPEGGHAADGTPTDGTVPEWASALIRNHNVFIDPNEFAPGTEKNPTPGPGGQTSFVDVNAIDQTANIEA